MNDIGKSALWALVISMPIFGAGFYLGMGLAHSSGFLLFLTLVLYSPIFLLSSILEWFQIADLNDTVYFILALFLHFISYFTVIHIIRTLIRALARPSSEEDT
jgi:hypothetical protein